MGTLVFSQASPKTTVTAEAGRLSQPTSPDPLGRGDPQSAAYSPTRTSDGGEQIHPTSSRRCSVRQRNWWDELLTASKGLHTNLFNDGVFGTIIQHWIHHMQVFCVCPSYCCYLHYSVGRYTDTWKVSWYPNAKNDTIRSFFSIDTSLKVTFCVYYIYIIYNILLVLVGMGIINRWSIIDR